MKVTHVVEERSDGSRLTLTLTPSWFDRLLGRGVVTCRVFRDAEINWRSATTGLRLEYVPRGLAMLRAIELRPVASSSTTFPTATVVKGPRGDGVGGPLRKDPPS